MQYRQCSADQAMGRVKPRQATEAITVKCEIFRQKLEGIFFSSYFEACQSHEHECTTKSSHEEWTTSQLFCFRFGPNSNCVVCLLDLQVFAWYCLFSCNWYVCLPYCVIVSDTLTGCKLFEASFIDLYINVYFRNVSPWTTLLFFLTVV